jgi:hypothetical protein
MRLRFLKLFCLVLVAGLTVGLLLLDFVAEGFAPGLSEDRGQQQDQREARAPIDVSQRADAAAPGAIVVQAGEDVAAEASSIPQLASARPADGILSGDALMPPPDGEGVSPQPTAAATPFVTRSITPLSVPLPTATTAPPSDSAPAPPASPAARGTLMRAPAPAPNPSSAAQPVAPSAAPAPEVQSTIAAAQPVAAPAPTLATEAPQVAQLRQPLTPGGSASAPNAQTVAPELAVGAQTLVEFASLQASASGAGGTGSVTSSSTRVIPGVVGSWTSAPLKFLPFGPSLGGSVFIGAPATGDGAATGMTSGGSTLRIAQSNNGPVIMPSLFMGLPVTETTSANLGTGVWVNNIKETTTLTGAGASESDVHSGLVVRPFLNAAIVQRVSLFDFPPGGAQEVKLSGGYVFADSPFQLAGCAAGQACLRTADQGSWFLGLSFQLAFPAGAAR